MNYSSFPPAESGGRCIASQLHLHVVRRRQAVRRIKQLHYLTLSQLLLKTPVLVLHPVALLTAIRKGKCGIVFR